MTQRLLSYMFLMLISPAFGLYQAFQAKSDRVRRWALIAFITFFGSVLYIPADAGFDGARHWQNLEYHYKDLSVSTFFSELGKILTLRNNPETNEDPYIHILSFFVAGVFQLPGLFFVIAAFIYGYFYAGSLFLLFQRFPRLKTSSLFFYLAGLFILWKSLDGVQYVRTFTGLWVLFYAVMGYHLTKKRKFLILMFLPPFLHIGYAIICIPAWLVLIAGVRKTLFVSIFIASFLGNLISPASVIPQINQTEVGASKVSAYYVEENDSSGDNLVEDSRNNTWYLEMRNVGVQNWATALIATSLILFGAYFKRLTLLESKLFSIGILTYAFANSTGFLFAVANRSFVVAGVFILATVLLMWQRGYFVFRGPKIKLEMILLKISALLLLPFLIYQLANSLYWYSAYILGAPFIPWVNSELNMTLRQVIAEIIGV